jgi:HSP20 family molecular chaperone IbpA
MADSTWVPKMDVSKTKDAMIVTTELPGVDANEIGLTLTGNLLTLKSEKGGVEAFPAASIQREGGRAR